MEMTNFQRLIGDMTKKGRWTEQQIADHVGISQANVSRLKRTKGAEPKHSTGVRLIRLHRRLTRRS